MRFSNRKHHDHPALPLAKTKYIWTEEQFYEVFGDYTTGFFLITPADGGRTYTLISTGESFTVMDDKEQVKIRIADYLGRRAPKSKK